MNYHIIILLLSIIIASFSQILLKKSASRNYASLLREYLNPLVISGYGLMFLSMFLTILSYSGLEFTKVPVMESLGYVLVMILSLVFFREKITFKKMVGMAFILGGILVYYL